MYSANPPFIVDPISFRLMQRLYWLLRQYPHLRQGIIGQTATLVPLSIVLVLIVLPICSLTNIVSKISPQISCPSIIGGVTFGCPFLKTLTSYPHTAHAFTLNMTPPLLLSYEGNCISSIETLFGL